MHHDPQHVQHIVAFYAHLLQHAPLDGMSLRWRHHLENLLYEYKEAAQGNLKFAEQKSCTTP